MRHALSLTFPLAPPLPDKEFQLLFDNLGGNRQAVLDHTTFSKDVADSSEQPGQRRNGQQRS